MTGLPEFYTQLDAVLRADAGVQAWLAATAPGKTWATIEGNVPVRQIEGWRIPGIGYEIGDVALTRQTNSISEAAPVIHVFFIWHEEDHGAAFGQRQALLEPLLSALAAKPTLNDAVAEAWLEKMTPDRSRFHPRHALLFDVAAAIEINH